MSTLIREHTDRGVNPDPAANCAHREQRQEQVRYREVAPGISPTCVRAMVMLAPRSVATIANPARTTLGYAPEATIATIRLAARVTVVASHAHGSLGADIEKNMVTMSRRRRSRSGRGYSTARAYQIAWTVSVGVVCYSPSELIPTLVGAREPAVANHRGRFSGSDDRSEMVSRSHHDAPASILSRARNAPALAVRKMPLVAVLM